VCWLDAYDYKRDKDPDYFSVKNGYVNGSIEYDVEIRLTDDQLEKLLSEAIFYDEPDACDLFKDVRGIYQNVLTLSYATKDYYCVAKFSEMGFQENSVEFVRYMRIEELSDFKYFGEVDDLILEAIYTDLKLLDNETGLDKQEAA